mmetsp:Transcript_28233/g.57322  ORF Transcript_28233/g.57322 Transcript_28233/m.57322 type:complete len:157 (+) Transcript_28233:1176-1646(+)
MVSAMSVLLPVPAAAAAAAEEWSTRPRSSDIGGGSACSSICFRLRPAPRPAMRGDDNNRWRLAPIRSPAVLPLLVEGGAHVDVVKACTIVEAHLSPSISVSMRISISGSGSGSGRRSITIAIRSTITGGGICLDTGYCTSSLLEVLYELRIMVRYE